MENSQPQVPAERVDMPNHDSARAVERRASHWLLADIIVPVLVTRLVLTTTAWLAMNLLQHQPVAGAWQLDSRGMVKPLQTHVSADVRPLVNMWSRWDAGWYFGVAAHGYRFVPGQPSNTAFYPLYPALMRVVHLFSRSNSDASWLASGIVVSNLCLVGALCYIYLLVRFEHDVPAARRAVIYVLVFPTTLFFSAVYTESLFLGLVVAAFYHARKNQWLVASLAGAAATLSRAPGVLLFLPLVYEYLAQRHFQFRKIRIDCIALLLIPLALAAYSFYLRMRFGTLLAISSAQGAWGRVLTPQWTTVRNFFSAPLAVHSGAHSLVDLIFVLLSLGLTIGVVTRLRVCYAVYSVAVLVFITAWGSFVSVPRYILASFPVFVVLAVASQRESIHRVVMISCSAFAAFFMILFALWSWVA